MACAPKPGCRSWVALGDQALSASYQSQQYVETRWPDRMGLQQRQPGVEAGATLQRLLSRPGPIDRLRLGSAEQWQDFGAWKFPHRLRPHEYIRLVIGNLSGNARTQHTNHRSE